MSSAFAFSWSPSSFRFRRCLEKTAFVALAFCTVAALPVQAQGPGSLDPTFVSALSGATIYSLYQYNFIDSSSSMPANYLDPNNPDQFLVVGGDTDVFGRELLPTGIQLSTDLIEPDSLAEAPSNFGSASRIVYTTVSDNANPGFFFIGGQFGKTSATATPKLNILRLSPGFVIDTSFNVGQGADDYVTAILSSSDNKVVVGGLFTSFNNTTHNHIVRLTDNNVNDGSVDGTIDPTFDPALNIDNNVLTLAEARDPATGAPNGKILVGGLFNQIDGRTFAKLARLNNDGSIDTTFAPVIDDRVNIVTVQPDGKVLIGGDFNTVNGIPVAKIARLNYNGTLDTTFVAGVAQVDSSDVNVVAVNTIVLLADGRMYVGGNFITVNGLTRRYLALLLANGAVDTSFDPGTNIINTVQTIVPHAASGDVYVGETVSRKVNNNFLPSVVGLYGARSSFFTDEVALGNGVDYLQFPNGNFFGYYSFLSNPNYIYHFDLGYEFVVDANDGQGGIYLYDFASSRYFYTSPAYPFPFLYDLTLKTVLYYFPDTNNPGHYTTNPRSFYNFSTGDFITLPPQAD